MSDAKALDFVARLKARQPKLVQVETKNLGTVYMRRPTGEDRWRLLTIQTEVAKSGVHRLPPAAVVAVSVVDERGAPYFEDLAEGYQLLSQIDVDDLNELYLKALEITGLGELALEAAEKKSSATPSDDSGSSSQATSEAAQ